MYMVDVSSFIVTSLCHDFQLDEFNVESNGKVEVHQAICAASVGFSSIGYTMKRRILRCDT